MNEVNKPLFKINNGTTGVAVFEQTRDTEYGPRANYSIVLRKGVKNKQTGQWDEYKITMFDEQALATAEMLRIAWQHVLELKAQQPRTTTEAQATDNIDSIDEEIPF